MTENSYIKILALLFGSSAIGWFVSIITAKYVRSKAKADSESVEIENQMKIDKRWENLLNKTQELLEGRISNFASLVTQYQKEQEKLTERVDALEIEIREKEIIIRQAISCPHFEQVSDCPVISKQTDIDNCKKAILTSKKSIYKGESAEA